MGESLLYRVQVRLPSRVKLVDGARLRLGGNRFYFSQHVTAHSQVFLYFRVCLEAAFGDKKRQFFDEMRRLLKCIPEGMDKKGNEISSKKGRFLAQRVASKHTLSHVLKKNQPSLQ